MSTESTVGNRRLLIFVIVVLLLKLFLFYFLGAVRPSAFMAKDSLGYIELATELAKNGTFTVDSQPALIRTPGYPALLALVIGTTGETRATIAIQIVLGVVTALALWFFLAKGSGDNFSCGVAGIAVVIILLDPNFSISQLLLLSETLFTFLVTISVVLLGIGVRRSRPRYLLLSFSLLAAAAYVRPPGHLLGLILFLIIGIGIMRWERSQYKKRLLRGLAGGGLLFCILIGAWVLRNYVKIGVPTFSTAGSVQLYENLGAAALARTEGRRFQAVRDSLRKSIYGRFDSPVERARYSRKEGLRLIKQQPFAVAATMAKGGAGIALDPGTGYVANMMGWRESGSGLLGRYYDMGLLKFIVHLFRHEGVLILLLVAGGIWHGGLLVSACVGIRVRSTEWDLVDTMMLVSAVYFVLVAAGPAGVARYRVPATPMVAYFAAFGGYRISIWLNRFWKHRVRN